MSEQQPPIIRFYSELCSGMDDEAARTLATVLNGSVLSTPNFMLVVNGGLHYWARRSDAAAGDQPSRPPVVTTLNVSRAKDLPDELRPIYQAFEVGMAEAERRALLKVVPIGERP